MNNNVVIFGANGLLGATLCPQLRSIGWRVRTQSRQEGADIKCNPLDVNSVRRALNECQPKAIINLIAISNVDYCETHVLEAYLAHVKVIEVISTVASELKSIPHIVHISTDHLYDGSGPHQEGEVCPINVYALSKLAGEMIALRAGATVLRTNFFGLSQSSSRSSFTDWIYKSLNSGSSITVFDDVLFSALNMSTLSSYISKSIEMRHKGVFNVGSREGISKAKLATIFAEELSLDTTSMMVGSIKDVLLPTPRPFDMRLDVSAFESKFRICMPAMVDQVREAAIEYRGQIK
jgi:dTDP-4-dehydrorhamnose reductase